MFLSILRTAAVAVVLAMVALLVTLVVTIVVTIVMTIVVTILQRLPGLFVEVLSTLDDEYVDHDRQKAEQRQQ